MNKKYDLVILGGGSGGISCAKEASKLGARVLCIDSRPEALGGTCVNVGCVPKKLLYQASSIINDNNFNLYGWDVNVKKHNWKKLINNIHKYIKNINNEYFTPFLI
jgi:pyruvate/2-oxoglutarate dehydrogenase complex dihydrolipoamide dehydrogenase (E3) component